ncbi:gene transfer agent family protein [Aliishimia ponticola]|uniref:Gene transfer agent family protein n=1 Tax=Aliishimia ponticola TaxID=2499833 RepID=A0A4S4NFF1_9RHOB|nr:gene transfer agent family protein [Aliishimia ponticola]THH38312.1 gene transfer agent family protein [Aliishimia ponticola]
MTNPWRGDVALVIDGERHDLRLSLGALAELEASLEAGSLVELVQRFEQGKCGSRDVLAVLRAGLSGAKIDPVPDLEHGQIEGGPIRAAQVAAELLVRAFSLPEAG